MVAFIEQCPVDLAALVDQLESISSSCIGRAVCALIRPRDLAGDSTFVLRLRCGIGLPLHV
jgi:hypothetical protein